MLDIKFVCENQDKVKTNLVAKKVDLDLDELIDLEENRKKALFAYETKKAEQNKISKLIGQYKSEGKDTKEIFDQVQDLSKQLKDEANEISEIQKNIRELSLKLPNMLDKDVPGGKFRPR